MRVLEDFVENVCCEKMQIHLDNESFLHFNWGWSEDKVFKSELYIEIEDKSGDTDCRGIHVEYCPFCGTKVEDTINKE